MTTQPPTDAARELLPCPFCGGMAETFKRMEDGPIWENWGVACTKCPTEKDLACSTANAIAAWNTRQQPEAGREGGEARLRAVLSAVRDDLCNENRLNTLSIADVIWHDEAETVVDFIEAALEPATRLAMPTVVGREEVARPPRLKYYPDYVDDADGLSRFRRAVETTPGHDMAAVNHNSLGRLIDTIERLRFERDEALLSHAEAGGASCDERIREWRNAFEEMHQRAMRAEALVRSHAEAGGVEVPSGWPGLSCIDSDEDVTRIADVPDAEIPSPTQAVRWLAKFSNPDEVASTTPRKIANELANICALLTASPAAVAGGEA